jgi:hypothetical protein
MAKIDLLAIKKNYGWAESNRRHVDFQSTALPTELLSRKSTIAAPALLAT